MPLKTGVSEMAKMNVLLKRYAGSAVVELDAPEPEGNAGNDPGVGGRKFFTDGTWRVLYGTFGLLGTNGGDFKYRSANIELFRPLLVVGTPPIAAILLGVNLLTFNPTNPVPPSGRLIIQSKLQTCPTCGWVRSDAPPGAVGDEVARQIGKQVGRVLAGVFRPR
jgi:hypothetical protein